MILNLKRLRKGIIIKRFKALGKINQDSKRIELLKVS